jgi:phosphotransferase system HPr (HPr) family protein
MKSHASAAIAITSKDGLDPELSAMLTMKATQFKCSVQLQHGKQTADAKKLIEVMSLGILTSELVHIHAEGEDAQQALNELLAVIQHYKV